uniref:Uncharacterized protein n=1 Tax=Otus sunia TaxID=257818 RepID=A0A8C8AEM6_9STRI
RHHAHILSSCWGTSTTPTSAEEVSQAWWRVPVAGSVVPATQKAEPSGSLEPRSSGLQCAMPSGHAH